MGPSKIFSRDFVLGFFAQFAFSSVFFILIPTIPIYLSRLGSTEAGIGVLVGAMSASSIILRPVVGRTLLRVHEKDFMIAGALIYAFASIAYLISQPFWPFLIVRIFQGIGLALFATASFSLILRISPEAHRGQSLSYFYLAINIAFALAPSFGMLLINHFDFTVLFLACCGLSLCSLFITMKLEKRPVDLLDPPSVEREPFLSRKALPPSIMAFMGSMIWGAVTAFFPLYALDHGVANPGLFFAALAITLIVARGFGGKILDRYRREKVLLPCLVAQIVAMVLLAFSRNLPMFILVAVIWGMGNAFFYPSLVAFATDLGGSSRGPAIGTYLALSDSGAGMGSVVMGIILQWTSYPIMFLSLALTGVLNLLYFDYAVRKKGGRCDANL
ncbi:MAG: MFS transporter [Thermodesulfobacteriota bacterium]